MRRLAAMVWRPPAHYPAARWQLGLGLTILAAAALLRLVAGDTDTALLPLGALGVTNVLQGLAEVLPTSRPRLPGLLRLVGLGCALLTLASALAVLLA